MRPVCASERAGFAAPGGLQGIHPALEEDANSAREDVRHFDVAP